MFSKLLKSSLLALAISTVLLAPSAFASTTSSASCLVPNLSTVTENNGFIDLLSKKSFQLNSDEQLFVSKTVQFNLDAFVLSECQNQTTSFNFTILNENQNQVVSFDYQPKKKVTLNTQTARFADQTFTLIVRNNSNYQSTTYKFNVSNNSNASDTVILSSEEGEPSPEPEPQPETFFNQSIQLNANNFDCSNVNVPQSQCEALVDLYNDTNGIYWLSSTNWLESNDLSTWHGITVFEGNITEINLSSNYLIGILPGSVINISGLQVLDVSYNSLEGIGSDTNYIPTIDFSYNRICQANPWLDMYQPNWQDTQDCDTTPPVVTVDSITTSILSPRITGTVDDYDATIQVIIDGNPYYATNNQDGTWTLDYGVITPDLSTGTYDVLVEATDLALNLGTDQTTDELEIVINQCSSVTDISQVDCEILLDFFEATGGENWNNNTNWVLGSDSTPATACDWNGITCFYNSNTDKHEVTLFQLNNNNLIGTIPESFWDLTTLTHLYITYNQGLGGELSPNIGNLVNLTNLTLFVNSFTGEIPSEIGNLTKLQILHISNNYFTGQIPYEIGNLTNLIELLLYSEELEGEIPASIWTLTNLDYLDLGYNNLSGEIPAAIGDLGNLYSLNLSSNNLTGEIPSEFSKLKNLFNLTLSYNNFSGQLPDLSSMVDLEMIRLTSNNFEGVIPSYLWDMPILLELSLGDNNLSGTVAFDPLDNAPLRFINIDGNNFEGAIPDFSQFASTLVGLSLGRNNFNPTLPPNLSTLINLQVLDLTDLLIPGELSSDFAPFLDGATLSLRNNRFSSISAALLAKQPANLILAGNALCQSRFDQQTSDWFNLYNLDGQASFSNCDEITPTVTINTYETSNPSPRIFGSVDEQVATIEVTIDGKVYTPTVEENLTWELTAGTISPPLSKGIYNIQIYVEDYSGNSDTYLYEDYLNIVVNACTGVTDMLTEDCEALLAFYNSTDGDNWTNNTNWLGNNDTTPETACDWFGISCTGNRVSSIGFNQENNLNGTIPDEVYNLAMLEYFNIFYNEQLSGEISPLIANLTSLKALSLFQLNLTGEIPEEIGSLTSLESINIPFNEFTGTIPTSIGEMPNLVQISIYSNSLTGEIPAGIFQNSKMSSIQIGGANITGNLPSSINNLQELYLFNIYDTQITGEIPSDLGSLPSLWASTLSNNRFTGEVPASLFTNQNLSILNIQGNRLTNLPDEVSIGNVTSFSFSSNYLCRSRMSQNLQTYLDTNYSLWENNQTCDETAPQITVDFLSTANPTPVLSGTINDYTATITVEINGTVYQAYNFGSSWQINYNNGFIYPVFEEGEYPIEITATDESGNQTTIIDTLSVAYNQCSNVQDLIFSHCEALLEIYNSTDGENWLENENWLGNGDTTPQTACDWFGVTCNQGAGVLELKLFQNNLSGVLPDVFNDLSSLITIELNNNNLSGNAPSSLFAYKEGMTKIDLSNNQSLELTIPSGIGFNLPNLSYLNLSFTSLSGVIPSSIEYMSNLQYLNLGSTSLSGTIPAEIGSLISLNYLNLNFTAINGSIPSSIGNLFNLGYLGIFNSQLSGSIPTEIVNLLNLYSLELGYNDLIGEIPSSIGNLTNLTILNLPYNNLSGPVPSSITNLINAEYILLNNNYLTSIPTNLDILTPVQFNIRSNNLCQADYAAYPELTSWLESYGNLWTSQDCDTTAPVVTIDTLSTPDTSPALTGTVDDPNATVVIAIEGLPNQYQAEVFGNGTWYISEGTISPPLVSGQYEVIAVATDLSGNVGYDNSSLELTISQEQISIGNSCYGKGDFDLTSSNIVNKTQVGSYYIVQPIVAGDCQTAIANLLLENPEIEYQVRYTGYSGYNYNPAIIYNEFVHPLSWYSGAGQFISSSQPSLPYKDTATYQFGYIDSFNQQFTSILSASYDFAVCDDILGDCPLPSELNYPEPFEPEPKLNDYCSYNDFQVVLNQDPAELFSKPTFSVNIIDPYCQNAINNLFNIGLTYSIASTDNGYYFSDTNVYSVEDWASITVADTLDYVDTYNLNITIGPILNNGGDDYIDTTILLYEYPQVCDQSGCEEDEEETQNIFLTEDNLNVQILSKDTVQVTVKPMIDLPSDSGFFLTKVTNQLNQKDLNIYNADTQEFVYCSSEISDEGELQDECGIDPILINTPFIIKDPDANFYDTNVQSYLEEYVIFMENKIYNYFMLGQFKVLPNFVRLTNANYSHDINVDEIYINTNNYVQVGDLTKSYNGQSDTISLTLAYLANDKKTDIANDILINEVGDTGIFNGQLNLSSIGGLPDSGAQLILFASVDSSVVSTVFGIIDEEAYSPECEGGFCLDNDRTVSVETENDLSYFSIFEGQQSVSPLSFELPFLGLPLGTTKGLTFLNRVDVLENITQNDDGGGKDKDIKVNLSSDFAMPKDGDGFAPNRIPGFPGFNGPGGNILSITDGYYFQIEDQNGKRAITPIYSSTQDEFELENNQFSRVTVNRNDFEIYDSNYLPSFGFDFNNISSLDFISPYSNSLTLDLSQVVFAASPGTNIDVSATLMGSSTPPTPTTNQGTSSGTIASSPVAPISQNTLEEPTPPVNAPVAKEPVAPPVVEEPTPPANEPPVVEEPTPPAPVAKEPVAQNTDSKPVIFIEPESSPDSEKEVNFQTILPDTVLKNIVAQEIPMINEFECTSRLILSAGIIDKDTDGDGLSDAFEAAFGLDPLKSDYLNYSNNLLSKFDSCSYKAAEELPDDDNKKLVLNIKSNLLQTQNNGFVLPGSILASSDVDLQSNQVYFTATDEFNYRYDLGVASIDFIKNPQSNLKLANFAHLNQKRLLPGKYTVVAYAKTKQNQLIYDSAYIEINPELPSLQFELLSFAGKPVSELQKLNAEGFQKFRFRAQTDKVTAVFRTPIELSSGAVAIEAYWNSIMVSSAILANTSTGITTLELPNTITLNPGQTHRLTTNIYNVEDPSLMSETIQVEYTVGTPTTDYALYIAFTLLVLSGIVYTVKRRNKQRLLSQQITIE